MCRCANCNSLLFEDLNGKLTIDYSSNFVDMYGDSTKMSELLIEIKCKRCKTFNTAWGR